MFRLISKGIATAALLCSGFYPQISYGETFKSAEFLEWPRDSQGFYLRTSIGMAGLIAGQNNDAQGKCISAWYFEREEDAHDELLAVMEKNPEYHPRGVILAVIEKRCGAMTY